MSDYAYDLTDAVEEFTGDYYFLSNFYPSPFRASVFGTELTYPTVEHYFQAWKATTERDHGWVVMARTPRQAKRRGREIELRSDWESIKVAVMRSALALKFPVDAMNEFSVMLLATGERMLIEGNHWGDQTWGAAYDGALFHTRSGSNLLGVLLMERRGALLAQVRPTEVKR